MKLSNYYFTFGMDEGYPFKARWVRVEAESLNQAQELFRRHFPDRILGVLNCADYYTEAQFERTGMAAEGNFGRFCHLSIE